MTIKYEHLFFDFIVPSPHRLKKEIEEAANLMSEENFEVIAMSISTTMGGVHERKVYLLARRPITDAEVR